MGAGGVLDIKAALYRQQQQAQQAQEDPSIAAERKSRKTAGVDVSLLVKKNAGVEARDQRDKEQIQARWQGCACLLQRSAAGMLVPLAMPRSDHAAGFLGWVQTPADRLAQSYAALEQKAELYDRLASGQHDDEEDEYNVDFLRKGTLQDEVEAEQLRDRQRGSGGAGPIDNAAAAVRGEGEVSCLPAGHVGKGKGVMVRVSGVCIELLLLAVRVMQACITRTWRWKGSGANGRAMSGVTWTIRRQWRRGGTRRSRWVACVTPKRYLDQLPALFKDKHVSACSGYPAAQPSGSHSCL